VVLQRFEHGQVVLRIRPSNLMSAYRKQTAPNQKINATFSNISASHSWACRNSYSCCVCLVPAEYTLSKGSRTITARLPKSADQDWPCDLASSTGVCLPDVLLCCLPVLPACLACVYACVYACVLASSTGVCLPDVLLCCYLVPGTARLLHRQHLPASALPQSTALPQLTALLPSL
jgi:hypothetical protein